MFCVYVKLYTTVERYLTTYVRNCQPIFEYQGVDAILKENKKSHKTLCNLQEQ